MNIQIPNKKISFSLLCTFDKVLYGDCLIDTDDDARGVEDEKHDDSPMRMMEKRTNVE